MRIAVALLLLIAAFAGCISQGPGPEPADMPPEDDTASSPHKVQRYRSGSSQGTASEDEPAATNSTQTPPQTQPSALANPVILPTPYNGAEPNMGITSTGALFATANSQLIRSLDNGSNWEVKQTHPLLNSDPMMWVDPYTDWIYHAPMFPALLCSSIYRSNDDGDSWDPLPSPACGRAAFDHQKLASGPPGPDGTPFPLQHDSVLYVCYNAVVSTNCAASYDNGETWPQDTPAILHQNLESDCGSGQNGHPAVRADGIVAFGKTWLCETPYLVYSTDSGASWNIVPAPADAGSSMLDPEIAFTEDGTLYMLYRGDDQLVYLLRTSDLGKNWDGPFQVSPPGLTSTVFGALGAGADGHIAFTFLGTDGTEPGTDPSDAPDDARWHLYMVHSDDADNANPSFTSYQVTPDDDPVQIGCVWLQGGANPCRNLLDFIDGAVAPDGSFYTVFTDGCTTECAGKEDATNADSRSRAITLARLDGFSLWPEGRPTGEAVDNDSGLDRLP